MAQEEKVLFNRIFDELMYKARRSPPRKTIEEKARECLIPLFSFFIETWGNVLREANQYNMRVEYFLSCCEQSIILVENYLRTPQYMDTFVQKVNAMYPDEDTAEDYF